MQKIYLDDQNGTPLAGPVIAAMQEALQLSGNPASLHEPGRRSAQALETARGQVSALIGARSEEMIFTSSGTEANHWALLGLVKPFENRARHLVLSAVEHLSIVQTARRMEKEGWNVTLVPTDRTGRIDPLEVEKAIGPETILLSIQWANGEVGTIQPMKEIVQGAKARGILVHSDAVAAGGRIPIDVRQVPVDALSVASNSMGGPAGAAALFVRKGVRIYPLLVGGTQEGGRRAGTENLPGIVGMGQAASLAHQEMVSLNKRLTSLRDRLIHGILERFPHASLNGHPIHRLPGHVSVGFPGMDAETLVLALDLEGIAVGIGSACSSRTMKSSHVLKAMGIPESTALGSVAFTLGRHTTEAEIKRVLDLLPKAAAGQQRVIERETVHR